MKDKKEYFSTKDYDMFKKLTGNRAVRLNRASKIVESIKNNGYITNPIIVNEKMEVIDGQGRLEALKYLDMPVDYIVVEGKGIKECIAMNAYGEKWRDTDYINSYAENGYKPYILLQSILEEYGYGLAVSVSALSGQVRVSSKILRAGTYNATEEDYINAKERLEWLKKFDPFFKRNRIVNQSTIRQALLIARGMKDVDEEKLFIKVTSNMDRIPTFNNTQTCADAIEELYNWHSPQSKYVYIGHEYRRLTKENQGKNIKDYNKKRLGGENNEGNQDA